MSKQWARIKDRVRKLLALSGSPYEAEAASALAKAKDLLSHEGLGLSDLDLDRPGVVELRIVTGPRISPWEKRLLHCILLATYTEALHASEGTEGELILVGREANVLTAKILYDYLHETVRRKADTFRDSIDDLESFRIGMVDSIRRKFQDQEQAVGTSNAREDITAAMAREQARESTDYVQAHYRGASSSNDWYGVDPNSFGLGQGIGRKIRINRQLCPPD
ncbi:MAG: DUF2786 domain-containing protein [Spirochaetales bacterium]|nr:DUF2786 domain-containing protein [Spirochaetales bacterium]